MKTILALLLGLQLAFSGCTVIKEPYFVETSCPRIEVLMVVPDVSATVRADGTFSAEDLSTIINGAKALRVSERYYKKQIDYYNATFVKEKH